MIWYFDSSVNSICWLVLRFPNSPFFFSIQIPVYIRMFTKLTHCDIRIVYNILFHSMTIIAVARSVFINYFIFCYRCRSFLYSCYGLVTILIYLQVFYSTSNSLYVHNICTQVHILGQLNHRIIILHDILNFILFCCKLSNKICLCRTYWTCVINCRYLFLKFFPFFFQQFVKVKMICQVFNSVCTH